MIRAIIALFWKPAEVWRGCEGCYRAEGPPAPCDQNCSGRQLARMGITL